MSKIWFTSDTHFGSERTLELSKRPFSDVKEMDYMLVRNWNSVVENDDIVYHLGDFGDLKQAGNLKGSIRLLKGNYEKDISTTELLKYGFEYVMDEETYSLFLEDETPSFHMCHEPKYMVSDSFNLFGHIHKLQMVKRNGLNVGVDCHNFYPIDLDTITFYRKAIENHYDENVFE